MGTILLSVMLATSGCYSRADDDDLGDDDDSDADSDADTDSDSDVDADADLDMDPPEVAIDPSGREPDGDPDGDGLENDVDTDDDDDGVPDDLDVDADGDLLVEDRPPQEVVDAAWLSAQIQCEWAAGCCSSSFVLQHYSHRDDFLPCVEGQFPALLVDLAQAAVAAGAAVDEEAWQAEKGSADPDESALWNLTCPDGNVEKGQVTRRETLDEILLPYFHGTTPIGQPCFTRWDCAVDGRCEGLAPGAIGTCAPRPWMGGPCATSEPYCPIGATCNVSVDGTICERPRDENEFCSVFDLGGRETDNCRADQWCDESLVTAACRPVLREGDPCTSHRQCLAFACTDQGDGPECPAAEDSFTYTQDLMRDWCHELLPTTEPLPD